MQGIDDSGITEAHQGQLSVEAPGWIHTLPTIVSTRLLPISVAVLAVVLCAVLARVLGLLDRTGVSLELTLETTAVAGWGSFVLERLRNRRLTREAEEKLRVLVDTSPAAIVTVGERGCIEHANGAAVELMCPHGGCLVGQPVATFLPQLHYMLLKGQAPSFRTSMEARGHRGNGDTFLAEMWCSSYRDGARLGLVAIIADAAEESPNAPSNSTSATPANRNTFSGRELDVLRLLVQGQANKEIALSMDLSESAIKSTLQRIFAKTQVRTRSQLVRVALEQYRELL